MVALPIAPTRPFASSTHTIVRTYERRIMYNPFRKKEQTPMETAIESTISSYNASVAGDTEEAKKVAENLRLLVETDRIAQNKTTDPTIKAALISAASSLAGILVIVNYEQMHALASKALPFIVKPRP